MITGKVLKCHKCGKQLSGKSMTELLTNCIAPDWGKQGEGNVVHVDSKTVTPTDERSKKLSLTMLSGHMSKQIRIITKQQDELMGQITNSNETLEK